MNKANLAILRDFLLSNNLQFEMCDYRADENGLSLPFTKDQLEKGVKGCGTAGCALGWAPFVIPVPTNILPKGDGYLNWVSMKAYCEEVFKIQHGGSLWTFLFSGDWSYSDNSRLGAAFRINDVITTHTWFDTYIESEDGVDELGLMPEYIKARDEWLATVEHS